MKIPLEVAKTLAFGDSYDDYRVVEESKWTHDDPKNEYKDVIFSYGGKFYQISNSRSGSPFTDWYYDSDHWKEDQEVDEVKRVEKIIYEWQVV